MIEGWQIFPTILPSIVARGCSLEAQQKSHWHTKTGQEPAVFWLAIHGIQAPLFLGGRRIVAKKKFRNGRIKGVHDAGPSPLICNLRLSISSSTSTAALANARMKSSDGSASSS